MMKQVYRSLCIASVCFFLIGLSAIQAQAQVISGKVTDEGGQPLPGVNVVKKGTTIGTTTDSGGAFSIQAATDDILVVSFIGYAPQEIRVGNQTSLSISLKEDVSTLQEVVVVGYGEQKKSDVTGAISSVSQEDLKQSNVATVDQALQGRVAGVQITNNSGAPGAAATINIRGISSLTGSTQPLYVIDGIQFDGTGTGISGSTSGANGQTVVNPLSTINPADIATIDVLKDASATAIYGSRASNGVIIITTKRGKAGESKISYSGQYGVATLRKKLDMMDLPQYAEYRDEIARETGQTPDGKFLDPSLLGKGTNWQDEVFRPAVQQSHSLTASGGTDRIQYAVMGGYYKQDGIAINSNLRRFSTRVNIDAKINNWIKIGTSTAYANTFENIVNDGSGDGVFSQALAVSPDIPVRNADGTYGGTPKDASKSAEVSYNPVAITMLRTNTLARQRLTSNNYLEVSLVKGLTFRSEIGFDNSNSQNINFTPTFAWGGLVNTENILQDRRDMSFNWMWKNYFTYNLTLAGGHNFFLTAGTEAVKNQYENASVTKKNLATNDIHVLSQGDNTGQTTNGVKNSSTLASLYARLNYNFNQRYLITLTLRDDGSSKFGPANRHGLFPAAAVAWHITNETFMPASNVLSDLKLRAGYGEVGNQNIGNYAYGSSLASVNSPFGTTYKVDRLANPNVKWESSIQTNVGLDFGLIKNRFRLSVDVYSKTIRNFLLEQPIPLYLGSSGGSNGGVFSILPPYVNAGNMTNKGIDIVLNSHTMATTNFTWDTDLTYSMYRNKITELTNGLPLINSSVYFYGVLYVPTQSEIGHSAGQFYGYQTEGLFQNAQDIQNHAVQVSKTGVDGNFINRTDGVWIGDIKFKDLNGDGVIDSRDQTYIGNPNPKFTFGFNNRFTYKNFSLGIFLTGSYGGSIFNASRIRTEGMQNISNNQLATVANRAKVNLIAPTESAGQNAADLDDITKVQLTNPNATIPRYSARDVNGNQRIASDRWIEDGSYIRVQNITFGYIVPQSIASKARLTYARVYANLQNAFVFTKYSGFDPEIGANNQNALQQGIDAGRYPMPRLFTVGVDLTF